MQLSSLKTETARTETRGKALLGKFQKLEFYMDLWYISFIRITSQTMSKATFRLAILELTHQHVLLWTVAPLNNLLHQLPYFNSYKFCGVLLFFCFGFQQLWKQVVIIDGNAFTPTSALADNTPMVVLLEAHRADFTTRHFRAFLTPTDFTAMFVLPRWWN